MKVYFTSEQMHTPEYAEYVAWVGKCWRLNDERNKRAESEKFSIQLMDDIALVNDGEYE